MAPRNTEPVNFQDKGLNLKDKEIWLVQVPADFEAAKASVKSEQEVVHEGTSYSLLRNDAQLSDCNILVAPGNDSNLISTSVKPLGVLTLTKKVSLPKVDYDKVRTPKPLVPQKENLRMRHFPTGYGPESFGIHEDEVSKKKHSLDADAEGSVPETKKRKSKETSESSSHEKKHKDKKSKDKHSKSKKEKDSSKEDIKKE